MQKQNWTSILLAVIVAIVAGLNYTYGLKIDTANVLAIATALIGACTILGHAIITHGQLSATDKAKIPDELLTLFQDLTKFVEATSPKQTGTAPEGQTTTTQPPPVTGN